MQLYNELQSKILSIKECLYPCKFTKSLWTDLTAISDPNVYLEFSKFITKKTSRYSYSALELLAEFGGYMGLFLGISVFQLKDGFNKLFHVIYEQ